jgi:hypothetical protein
MKIPNICSNCKFWENENNINNNKGKCRINAPTVLVGSMSNILTIWPRTNSDDWCGQFKLIRNRRD